MERYSQSKIYRMVCNITGVQYIGSTCLPTLAKRLAYHRKHYKEFLNNTKNFITSFKILENNDYSIILIEEYPCETKEQLLARERFHIENNVCVNKNIPTRTLKEWKEDNKEYNKEYREQNKEKIKQKNKEYREQNKEIIKQKNKEYREQNKEKIKEWREANKDKLIEYKKQYREKKNKELL
jgi:hypothetical protein